MNKNKKDLYSEEFRSSSIKLALDSNQPYAQTARELGIKANTLYNWIAANRQAITGGNPVENDEIKRLRAENTKLKTERDILKKAAAYFAKNLK
jgi:transposase